MTPILPPIQTYLLQNVQIPTKWEFPKWGAPLAAPLLPSLAINPTFNLSITKTSPVQEMPPPILIEIKPQADPIEWGKLFAVVSLVSVGLIMVTVAVAAELDDERKRRIELEQELNEYEIVPVTHFYHA